MKAYNKQTMKKEPQTKSGATKKQEESAFIVAACIVLTPILIIISVLVEKI
jgi:hypothetical protein